MQLQSDGAAPVLSTGQRLGACAATRSVWMHAGHGARACSVWPLTRECSVTRERMTDLGSLWEEHGSTSVCAICCSRDGWPWALCSEPAYVFQVYVLYASFWILYMFYLDVAYIAMAIHVCCKCVFEMFQLFSLDVICCSGYTCMYIVSVCSKCFICFRHMLQMFLSGCCICYSGYTHMLQTYV
jgi:hypothetical protein